MTQLPPFAALTLDVGGVFVVPEHRRLEQAFTSAGLDVDPARFWDGHYLAMHAVDADQSPAETFSTYVPAFCHHVGLEGDAFTTGVAALEPLFGPSHLWCEPIPGSVDGIRALDEAGIPLAVVSNADGSAASLLVECGVCQEGPGPLVSVVTVVDSGALGIAKPDPGTFTPALEALGTDPAATVHVGDSVHYDVRGAQTAGMQAVHFDPRRLCALEDHAHITSLAELVPAFLG